MRTDDLRLKKAVDRLLAQTSEFWIEQNVSGVHEHHRKLAMSCLQNWGQLVAEFGFTALNQPSPTQAREEVGEESIVLPQIDAKFEFNPRIATIDGVPVSLEQNAHAWHEIRRTSIGATDARFLVKKNGQARAGLDRLPYEKASGYQTPWVEAFELGVAREPLIAAAISQDFREFNLRHNQALFVGESERHVATPDMIGDGIVGEIKVSTKDLRSAYSVYHDQLQWQMHVTGANSALFVVENRYTQARETMFVDRDQARIELLVHYGDLVLERLDKLLREPKKKFEVRDLNLNAACDEITAEEIMSFYRAEKSQAVKPRLGFERASLVSGDGRDEEFEEELDDEYEPFIPGTFRRESGKVRFPTADTTQSTNQVPLDLSEGEVRRFKWKRKRLRKLLKKYLKGHNVYQIAFDFDVEPADVMAKLTKLLLEPKGKLVNTDARNFGKSWTKDDFRRLDRLWKLKTPLKRIAKKIGRDQLGVAFVIFERHSPPISAELIKKFDLY